MIGVGSDLDYVLPSVAHQSAKEISSSAGEKAQFDLAYLIVHITDKKLNSIEIPSGQSVPL
jgi:hypothetical protein